MLVPMQIGPVEQKCKQIYDLIDHPCKQQDLLNDSTKWNKLCVSMDVINDTQIAINNYFSLPSFKAENGGYLFLYGLLQAFFLQQDSINHLSEALFGKSINWKADYPDIYLVRELRNDSIGHPTKRGKDESFHFIARHSVSKEHFILNSYYSKNKNSKSNNIDINELKSKQEKSVIEILDRIIKLMEEEYEKHKSKSKNEKLSDLISKELNYSIGKIYECIHDYEEYHHLLEGSFDNIKKTIEAVKKGVIDRYGKLSALQGLDEVIRKIDYILQRIDSWIKDNLFLNNLDVEIFFDSFSDRVKELQEMLIDIDNEFK